MTINMDFLNKEWNEVIDMLPPLCEIQESTTDDFYSKIAYDKKTDTMFILELTRIVDGEKDYCLNPNFEGQEGKTHYRTPKGVLVKPLEGQELEYWKNNPMNYARDGYLVTQITKRIEDLDKEFKGTKECLKIVEDLSGHSSYASGYNLGKLESLSEEKESLKKILKGEYGKE